ncbi:MAG: hypothetical protein HQL31_02860, partial [Planctomycetes bacterium]|nr:hypothetical protein [Planctomycetota bacterium]
VVDFQTSEVRHFPETQFGEASPYVDVETGTVFWQCERTIWKRGPQPDAPVEWVNAIPDEIVGARQMQRTATHLTRSADGREFFVDLGFQLQWPFGSLPVDGGAFQQWHSFNRVYNHAQFSPTDPDEVLFAEEIHGDPVTGLVFPITNRLWLIRRGQQPRPILREPTVVCHEWWDADGEHVWCVFRNETWRVRVADGTIEKIVFPHHCWHAHASRDGRLIVTDEVRFEKRGYCRGVQSHVNFMDRNTGKELLLADNPEQNNHIGRNYHIDPHPRFVCGDRYVVFTTTVLGEIDVAIVPTATLIGMTT